jgi:hypothetical protein
MTPAVGSKPPGFRSVLRGRAGDKATLYWWEDQRLWRLEHPVAGPITHTQQVLIHPPAETDAFAWQWCDLTGRDAADAREINWHPCAPRRARRRARPLAPAYCQPPSALRAHSRPPPLHGRRSIRRTAAALRRPPRHALRPTAATRRDRRSVRSLSLHHRVRVPCVV